MYMAPLDSSYVVTIVMTMYFLSLRPGMILTRVYQPIKSAQTIILLVQTINGVSETLS
jgi:hypothetical protein